MEGIVILQLNRLDFFSKIIEFEHEINKNDGFKNTKW